MANFTEKLIVTTFTSMLERTPLDKITVTALINEANISRNTFYYHYEDIYDLLDQVMLGVLEKYENAAKDMDLPEVFKSFLYACKANRKKVYNIFNSISRDRLERYVFQGTNSAIMFHLMKMAQELNVKEERAKAVADIVRYSIYGFFTEFLWEGMKGDIEKKVDELWGLYGELLDCMFSDHRQKA
ncbi:MAG: TetR/AcrR family transcriptional regulator [Bacillota bacterium]|nr:TetR/AcrR family transcriptional regulator [Bacillota bacterium]